VEHPFLERAHAGELVFLNALPEPAPDRCVRIGAEIKPVVAEDSLQQQLDLDPLEIGLEPLPVGIASRRRFRYLYSHTRSSDNSCSVSTGFVM
jgi:hypothetical protein